MNALIGCLSSPNFSGYRVCVQPYDPSRAVPGFYATASEFGFSGRLVRSVRKGCWGNLFNPPAPQGLQSDNN